MSAEENFQIASSRIEDAIRHSADALSFSDLVLLRRLPPEISELKSLMVLGLENTEVTDLEPLRTLEALRHVFLGNSAVTDLGPLVSARLLEILDISETRVESIAPIGEHARLQRLDLSNTRVTDLVPLQGLQNLKRLALDGTKVESLHPLKTVFGLRRLNLNNSKVTDLAPIAFLHELQTLTIVGTEIADLRPLLNIDALWNKAGRPNPNSSLVGGIWFYGTSATKLDPKLNECSAIKDPRRRAEETRNYLRSLPPWPEPLPSTSPPAEPKQRSSLDFIWTANGFALNSTPVSVDDDPVALATRDDLVKLMNELCRQSGNHHDDIFRRGDTLRQRLEEPELDLLRIHLAFQRLQRVYDQRGNREDPLQSNVEATLQDVVETLPGLTLGDERVRELLERQARNRTDRVDAAKVDAEIGVLQAVAADDAPFDEEAQELAEDASIPVVDDQLTRSRPTLAWNAIVAVGQEFKNAPLNTTTIAVGLPAAVYASAPWLVVHADEILVAARLWGAEFFGWINPIISQARAITEAMNQRQS